MQKTKAEQIIIPEGHFEGRCEDCVHSMRTGQDTGNPDKDNREMYCEINEKTFFPKNMQETNCSHYKMKTWTRIKRILLIILAIYFAIGLIEIIADIL